MSVEDTTMADPVPAESSIDNDQQRPNDGIPEATEPQSSTGDDGVQKETAHSSNQIDQLEEAPAQVEEETTTTDISQIEQVQDQAIGQQVAADTSEQADGSEMITITTVGETPGLSNLTQVSQISSDQGGEVTQITGLPPGVSLIQADQGQDGEGAIFLLVTGPVDGEGGTANAIAVDAATAAAMASLQNPLDAVSSGQSISIEDFATVVSTSTGRNDSVAEILSSLTGERTTSTTDDSAVVQVAANAEAEAAATSKAYPTPSEMSLAQDILALASSALSSSTSTTTKDDEKDGSGEAGEDKEMEEDQEGTESNEWKPSWANLLSDFQKIGDSFYGFVKNEVEMDQVLNAYKKETNSLFAIRQTPSPVKEENGTVRLMWKSQHVPYDGTPFINIGRRATVMECEHGPRKKTNALKRMFNSSPADKASLKNIVNLTCPARVFIKKVRKFPEFKVVSTTDPKILRSHQEQSLKQLRDLGMSTWTGGEIRLYMQLPDANAHRYHMIGASTAHAIESAATNGDYKTDINPRVVTKVKEVVRQGLTSPFIVRQIARHFVEKEMVTTGEDRIPKHDRTYYPSMIEIQNLTQQIQADLLSGALSPLPLPAEGYPQTKPKKRRSSVKSFGEPSNKRAATNGDSGAKREDEGENLDGAAESTTIGTFSLTLPEGQLENFSIANLNMEQLQQLAKIGLLALNNATSGKSTNGPLASATVTESGTIEIEAAASQAESTSTVETTEAMPSEAVVLLTSSMQEQVTSSEAQDAVQAIESVDLATSTLEDASASSSVEELPSMVVTGMEIGEAQPSTTTTEEANNEDSVVSSAEATTTTDNTDTVNEATEES